MRRQYRLLHANRVIVCGTRLLDQTFAATRRGPEGDRAQSRGCERLYAKKGPQMSDIARRILRSVLLHAADGWAEGIGRAPKGVKVSV